MKIRYALIAMAWLAVHQTAPAQTAETYISQGRGFLGVTNLISANTSFSNAMFLSPGHQTGAVFYASTRILAWPGTPVASNLLNRLGFSPGGRSVYNWTSSPPRDAGGVFIAPPGVNANEVLAVLRTNFLSELLGADANLAVVTNTSFLLTLTSNETRMAAATVDYGDVKMLRSMVQGAEYCAYSSLAWDFTTLLTTVRSLYSGGEFNAGQLFANNPALLTFITASNQNSAKLAFQSGADRYFEASQFIRGRPANIVRIFNLDGASTNQEADFRKTLANLTNSLAHSVTLTVYSNYAAYLGAQFAGPYSPRNFFPALSGTGFGLGTMPDTTFGGLMPVSPPGIVKQTADKFLARSLVPIPTIGPWLSTTGGQVRFPVNVLPGRSYAVQASSNLTTWSNTVTFVASSNIFTFADTNAHSFGRRFYRALDRSSNPPPTFVAQPADMSPPRAAQ